MVSRQAGQLQYSGVYVWSLSATFAWQYHLAKWSAACQRRWGRAIGSLDYGILLQADLHRICALGKVSFVNYHHKPIAYQFQDQYLWMVDANGEPNRFYDEFHSEYESYV